MKIRHLATATGIVASLFLATQPVNADDKETKKQTEERMIKETKQSADRADNQVSHFEVKKTHDDHIKATEKAAGKAAEKDKK